MTDPNEPLFVVKAIHVIYAFLITGGGGATILGWKLTKPKKKSSNQLLEEHKEEDNTRFEIMDKLGTTRHIETIERINTVGNDVAFIKGKLENWHP